MDQVYEFLANTADGVFVVDDAQTIVLWNRPAQDILGYRPKEALGKTCHELLRGRDCDGCALCRRDCGTIQAARKLKPYPTIDMIARDRRGKDIGLSISTMVVPAGDRRLSGLVHLFRERTRQQEMLRAMDRFAEVMSSTRPSRRRGRVPRPADLSSRMILTPREKEILGRLVAGESTGLIADRLSISPRTVRNHITNLLAKLGVHSRLEAVTYSIRNGLV